MTRRWTGPDIVAIAALDPTTAKLVNRWRVDEYTAMRLWAHTHRAKRLRYAYVVSETMAEAIADIRGRVRGTDPHVVYGLLPNQPHELREESVL